MDKNRRPLLEVLATDAPPSPDGTSFAGGRLSWDDVRVRVEIDATGAFEIRQETRASVQLAWSRDPAPPSSGWRGRKAADALRLHAHLRSSGGQLRLWARASDSVLVEGLPELEGSGAEVPFEDLVRVVQAARAVGADIAQVGAAVPERSMAPIVENPSPPASTTAGPEGRAARILQVLTASFLDETGIDVEKDPVASRRVREAADKAAYELNVALATEVNLPFLSADESGPKHLALRVTRELADGLGKRPSKRSWAPPEPGDDPEPKPPRARRRQRWVPGPVTWAVVGAILLAGFLLAIYWNEARLQALDGTPVGERPPCISGNSRSIRKVALAPSAAGDALVVLDTATSQWEAHRYDGDAMDTETRSDSCERLTSYDAQTGERIARELVSESEAHTELLGAGAAVVWLQVGQGRVQAREPRALALVADNGRLVERNPALASHVFNDAFRPNLQVSADGTLAATTDDGRTVFFAPPSFAASEERPSTPDAPAPCTAGFVRVDELQVLTPSGLLELVGEWPRNQLARADGAPSEALLEGRWVKQTGGGWCAAASAEGVLLAHRTSLRDDATPQLSLVGFDGVVRWTTSFEGSRPRPFPDEAWTSGTRFLLEFGRGPDGAVERFIGAVDAATGKLLWETRL